MDQSPKGKWNKILTRPQASAVPKVSSILDTIVSSKNSQTRCSIWYHIPDNVRSTKPRKCWQFFPWEELRYCTNPNNYKHTWKTIAILSSNSRHWITFITIHNKRNILPTKCLVLLITISHYWQDSTWAPLSEGTSKGVEWSTGFAQKIPGAR